MPKLYTLPICYPTFSGRFTAGLSTDTYSYTNEGSVTIPYGSFVAAGDDPNSFRLPDVTHRTVIGVLIRSLPTDLSRGCAANQTGTVLRKGTLTVIPKTDVKKLANVHLNLSLDNNDISGGLTDETGVDSILIPGTTFKLSAYAGSPVEVSFNIPLSTIPLESLYSKMLTIVTPGTAVESDTVSFNSNTAGDLFYFTAISTSIGSGLPSTMFLTVSGTLVAQVDFTQRYLGKPFTVVLPAKTYTGVFTDGTLAI
jgi:hypothetical protein